MDSPTLQKKIDNLRPWRYNHIHNGLKIEADNDKSARVHDEYGKKLICHVLDRLLSRLGDPGKLRAIDLGCLEGHYSDILCSYGFKEVVCIDLSEQHVARAQFLLNEFKGYSNAKVIQGNVLDQTLMLTLGKFDVILFHGLLYHQSSPVLIFDIIEQTTPKDRAYYLLLGHQYHMSYDLMVAPYPVAEVQIRPFEPDQKGLVHSPKDQSVFDRASIHLNATALHKVLSAYGYKEMLSYDTPSGIRFKHKNYACQFVLSKCHDSGLLRELNTNVPVANCKFYNWHGNSADHYRFNRSPKAILCCLGLVLIRFAAKASRKLGL